MLFSTFLLLCLASLAAGQEYHFRQGYGFEEPTFKFGKTDLIQFYEAEERYHQQQRDQYRPYVYRQQRNTNRHPTQEQITSNDFAGSKRAAPPPPPPPPPPSSSNGFFPDETLSLEPESKALQIKLDPVQKSPWNLIDPTTGRTLNEQPNAQDSSFGLLGLPVDSFSPESAGSPSIRNERENIAKKGSEYFSASGHPVYKMKKKYPLGYSGRRRRSAQLQQLSPSPWNLIDPNTGRSFQPEIQLQEHLKAEQIRLPRDGVNFDSNLLESTFEKKPIVHRAVYLDSLGSPVYRQHKKYPYSG